MQTLVFILVGMVVGPMILALLIAIGCCGTAMLLVLLECVTGKRFLSAFQQRVEKILLLK